MKEYKTIQGAVYYIAQILNETADQGWTVTANFSLGGENAAVIVEREKPTDEPKS